MSGSYPVDAEIRLRHTRDWVERVVIGLALCPFAAQPFREEKIRWVCWPDKSVPEILEAFLEEVQMLDTHPEWETSLLILPGLAAAFDDYLDLLDMTEALLVQRGYEGIFQVASFHPEYRFEGHAEEDPANYTNRSPYPMFHLIREESITRALAHYSHPEQIPVRNKTLLRHMGLEVIRQMAKPAEQVP